MKQPEKTQRKFRAGQLEARTLMIALAHQIIPHSIKISHDGRMGGRSLSHPSCCTTEEKSNAGVVWSSKALRQALSAQVINDLMMICEPDW